MTSARPDITRSAYGHLASEAALLPTAFRLATWTQGDRADTAIATWRFGQDTETAELRVDPGGELTEVPVQGWCPYGFLGFRERRTRKPPVAATGSQETAGGPRRQAARGRF